MSIMDNGAIERIATPDLTNDALALLNTYGTNDDVIFFLGRLVWQGDMVNCAPVLAAIACDSSRGLYARIAAIRGVMAVGEADQKERVWKRIADSADLLDHAILAELFDWTPPTTHGVELVLRMLEHTAPFERFSTSGVDRALHLFIERLPIMSDEAEHHPLGRLVEGLNNFLQREPFIERGECHVSEEFAWIMPPALHAVDRLVAARSAQAYTQAAIAVMRNVTALRFWCGGDVNDYKDALSKNVPRWRYLNDLLYWTSVSDARVRLERKGQPLVDDWQVAVFGHFWSFGPEDFERCLEWARTKGGDDRSVAISRCVLLYVEADRPAAWLAPLRAAVADSEKLTAMLEARLDPKPSPEMEKINAEHQRWKRRHERRERKEKRNRADWVRALRADPDRILHPVGLKPGEFSRDQYYLLASIMNGSLSTSREDGANWQSLVPDFGEAVARAYRDAAVAHWRAYRPKLRSEGADSNSTPYSLLFAMAGLAIEAAEDSAFAERLSQDEARVAFRYITCELNGFPAWFERLYRAFPEIGHETVAKELLWELEHSVAEHPLHYILHDIWYHAPWLHADTSPLILDWLRANKMPSAEGLRYCINILTSGGIPAETLAELAAENVANKEFSEQQARWFSLWVDTDPDSAIPSFEAALEELPPDDASALAQQFVVGLLGDRHGTGTRIGAYRNARHLKALYLLMHRFIRVTEDIERANKGVYSPTLRDDAQEARDRLFNMLVEVPGAEAYAAIKALEAEHPDPGHRRWMAARARDRATMDADEPAWTAEQVRDFARKIAGL
ncbi:hypothetical protein [Bradyrhizobium sp. B120]|uniref:hypothetical protein n=1 Tax=Bradyrhizobium sp. B120 TaxID=3410088 RepID=UPI003B981A82